MNAAGAAADFGSSYAAEQIRRSRHPLRRFVKGYYLRRMLREVEGACIDFGCGAGQLLEQLPAGSSGLEVNPHLIAALRGRGLDVRQARGESVDFDLAEFETGRYRSLVIAHVLEHLPDPAVALERLFAACSRIGIVRIVVVVPGALGYASDATHRTFIDQGWLDRHMPRIARHGFGAQKPRYFPGPWAAAGRWFVFHETQVVFDRR